MWPHWRVQRPEWCPSEVASRRLFLAVSIAVAAAGRLLALARPLRPCVGGTAGARGWHSEPEELIAACGQRRQLASQRRHLAAQRIVALKNLAHQLAHAGLLRLQAEGKGTARRVGTLVSVALALGYPRPL